MWNSDGGNDSDCELDEMMYLMSGSAGDADLDDADDEEPIGEWNFIREFETSIEIDLVDQHLLEVARQEVRADLSGIYEICWEVARKDICPCSWESQFPLFSEIYRFLKDGCRNIKIPERWVENEILDSIVVYTKKMCTIPALLLIQTKHINKQAIKSLKYFNPVPLNKIMTTVKVWPWSSSE